MKVFISYSHDTPQYKENILCLANKLREDGIDTTIDQYVEAPPEGWPKWMLKQIKIADFVLIAISKNYSRRMEGDEELGKGLGATWEGAIITQQLYSSQTNNLKFIPILICHQDIEHMPLILQGSTFYNLENLNDYEKMYRYLTGQPLISKPPLGEIKKLSSEKPTMKDIEAHTNTAINPGSLCLLYTISNGWGLFKVNKIDVGEQIHAELEPLDLSGSAFLNRLQSSSTDISLSFNLSMYQGRVTSIRSVIKPGYELFEVNFARGSCQTNYLPMAVEGYSDDELAIMRARRILFDEKLPTSNPVRDALIELQVRGFNTPIQILNSPFVAFMKDFTEDPDLLKSLVRLYAVFCLVTTKVVEEVHQLDVKLHGSNSLDISFRGIRPKYYHNIKPIEIVLNGTLQI